MDWTFWEVMDALREPVSATPLAGGGGIAPGHNSGRRRLKTLGFAHLGRPSGCGADGRVGILRALPSPAATATAGRRPICPYGLHEVALFLRVVRWPLEGRDQVLGDIKNMSPPGILTNGGSSGNKVKWSDIARRGLAPEG